MSSDTHTEFLKKKFFFILFLRIKSINKIERNFECIKTININY